MNPVFALLPSMGTPELLIVGVVAVLLFGKRLPEVARNVGRGLMEFRKGLYDIQDEVKRAAYSDESGEHGASLPEPEPDRDEPTAPRFELPENEPGEEIRE
ncbi:MAG TPA: twin-arginine translocase TatA/TatE family subunit [Thermoguttaceae bacterium]|nr:twin-arginine translocase TatA/TatE family subunit [Thermoguttaceae bacterium]